MAKHPNCTCNTRKIHTARRECCVFQFKRLGRVLVRLGKVTKEHFKAQIYYGD
jgi:hypothetical protein